MSKKKSVLVIELGRVIHTSLSGGDKIFVNLLPYLSSSFQITVLVPEISTQHWENLPVEKILLPKNIFDTHSHPIFAFLTYCYRILSLYRLKRTLPSSFDIVYSSTNIFPDVLAGYFIRRNNHTQRWVARVHHLIPPPTQREGNILVNTFSYLFQTISNRYIKKADCIIALNTSLKHTLIQLGFPKSKIFVSGGGVTLSALSQYMPKRKEKKYDGVFVGRLHKTKGVFDLLSIWQEVIKKRPQSKLVIIGSGPKGIQQKLQQLIYKKNLTASVQLKGFVSEKILFDTLSKSTVFLFTDHEAGFGLAVAEAMVCGLPVVGFDIGVLGHVFQKGYLLAPLGDHKTFAQHIIRLLEDRTLYQKLKREALDEAKKYEWESIAKEFSSLLSCPEKKRSTQS